MSRIQATTANKTIGANEDMFLKAFETTPKLNIITQKKLENELQRCITSISNPSADWDHRVQAMKLFRSIVNSGIFSENDELFMATLKNLEIPFQNNICDLRSQVVRETCITIAFLSCRLQNKFSRMAEMLLPSLIKLIPNSAKIISTSALVALRFIIQSTHNSRLITVIKYQLSTSKSKEIHRALCEIAERIVTIWAPQTIEKHINDFVEVLRLGICDSDEAARQFARRAFNVFAEHFREHADKLYSSLDQQRQRMLNNLNHGGGSTLSMNNYGSATSGLNIIGLSSVSSSHQHQPQPTTHHHIPTATTASNNHPNNHASSSMATSRIHHFGHNYQSSPSSGYGQSSSSSIVSRLKSSLMSTNGLSSTSAGLSASSNIATTTTTTTTTSAAATSAAVASTISSIPKTTPVTYMQHVASPSRIRTPTARSTSAIDVNAQQRARARAVYLSSMYHRPRQLAGDVTPSPLKSNLPQPTSNLQSGSAALNKAASYLASVINNTNIAESQIVTTIKYFNSLIDKQPPETISQLMSEIMPPLVIGADHSTISVRKASVFAMVATYAKVGLERMEPYLTSLTVTQRKLLEVYIKKHDDETPKSLQQTVCGESSESKYFSSTSMTSSNSSYQC